MNNRRICLGTSASFGRSVSEQLRLFAGTGFDAFFCDWLPQYTIGKWAAEARSLGLDFQSIHAPFSRAADMWGESSESGDAAVDELIACLHCCAENGVPIMVAHAFIGFEKHSPTAAGVDRFGKVVREADKCGVKLALENTEGEEYLAALMNAFADENSVGFCWDSGHEMCYNRSRNLLALYGDRLIATHLNDNLGISDYAGKITWHDDLHLLPFDGVANWSDIALRLDNCGFDGIMTFELLKASKPGRHDNDKYFAMPIEQYLAECYARACRVAALRG